ncbi:contractile injection system protein, VgrG/Pvc8 family [Thioclava sp.]|uniref:phage late control D family protein n=1 Tax=Thioclava sp. TaxID=1933450 RepID=UPI003242D208
MTPDFKIVADGEDVTATIADRLLSLSIVDEDGTKSDRLELQIDDRDGRVAFPDMNASIEVWLGFKSQQLSYMGRYAVDQVKGAGPTQVLEVGCKPADMKSEVRAPQTRAWEDVTLQSIVAKIAAEAKLRPVVSASIASAHWGYIAQTAESNLHFLTRLAAPLDATAKPVGDALVVQKRGEGKSAAGDKLEPPSLTRSQLTSWRWDLDGRKIYRKIEAEWSEPGAGKRHLVTRGKDKPSKRLRHCYASKEEAERAADGALSAAARGALKISIEVAGFRPSLLAGASVKLDGLRPELNGEWHLTRVQHRFGGALFTSFEATKGAAL